MLLKPATKISVVQNFSLNRIRMITDGVTLPVVVFFSLSFVTRLHPLLGPLYLTLLPVSRHAVAATVDLPDRSHISNCPPSSPPSGSYCLSSGSKTTPYLTPSCSFYHPSSSALLFFLSSLQEVKMGVRRQTKPTPAEADTGFKVQ